MPWILQEMSEVSGGKEIIAKFTSYTLSATQRTIEESDALLRLYHHS